MSDPTLPTVWLVEDSPSEAERVQSLLAGAYDVSIFTDGPVMLERLVHAPLPDLLIVDWQLPGMSGIEITQFLRGNAPTASVAILLLTANDRAEDLAQGLAAGANDYIAKPYQPVELTARVASLLRQSSLRVRAERAEGSALALLRGLPEMLITLDSASRKVIYANHESERVLEQPMASLVGRDVLELLPGLALDRVPKNVYEQATLPDIQIGEAFYSPLVRSVPPGDSSGTTLSLREVTASRTLQARRLDFYSIVAHDLRTPLQAAMLKLDVVLRREKALAENTREDLGKVRERLLGLSSMVTDFLDLARLDASATLLQRESLDLGQLVTEMSDDFRALAQTRTVSLQCVVSSPGLMVSADPRRLGQVVTNLLSNAIKFTPAGGTVEAQVTGVADGSEGGVIEVSVRDSGRGIPAEALGTLFDRYTRAVANDVVPGTGLGLMIVREIVDAHGGTLGVESTLGEGSRFWFRLPRAI